MKGFKAALFLGSVVLLCFATVVGYNALTDGFSVQQMASRLPYNVMYETSPVNEQHHDSLKAILDQPYSYIGKGCQFYAFQSADGRYVLKFLKQKHLRLWTELNQIPMPYKWRQKADLKINQRKMRVKRLFSSCKLAYEEMPHESGLLYIHLNKTPFFQDKICIQDKMGLKHKIMLDDYEFILQESAIPLTSMIAAIVNRDDFEEQMSERIDQLIKLICKRCEKGICDRDRSFVKNVAFVGDEAIFIDIGQFYKDPSISKQSHQQDEIRKRLYDVIGWMQKHYPGQAATFKSLVDARL